MDDRRTEVLTTLTSMGYSRLWAIKALRFVDPNSKNAVAECFQWFEEHPEQEDTKEAKAKIRSKKKDEMDRLITAITNLGLQKADARMGLRKCKGNVHDAIVWILRHKATNLENLIRMEKERMASHSHDSILARDHSHESLASLSSPAASDSAAEEKTHHSYEDEPVAYQPHFPRDPDIRNPPHRLEDIKDYKMLAGQILELQSLVLSYQQKFITTKQTLREEKVKTRRLEASLEKERVKRKAKRRGSNVSEAQLEQLQGAIALNRSMTEY